MPAILWRQSDGSGHDRAVIEPDADGVRLAGTAVFGLDGAAYDIRYTVIVDPEWRTRVVAARVQGPGNDRRLSLQASGEGTWFSGEEQLPDLAGAFDVDFGFTPATNTLPIRRLGLDIGEAADIQVVYVDFPGHELRREEQRYEHTAPDRYLYGVGDHQIELIVNEHGLLTEHPGGWTAVAS